MPGLGFLSPLFLLGTFAVAVPIVLHLFRRRNDPVVPFSAVRFLTKVPIEQARRRRLQDLLLLALRAAALLLLALGFARPYLRSANAAGQSGVTVVAVDTSASLGDEERFGRAKALAGEAISNAPANHSVALVKFDAQADLLLEPTTDRGAARAIIDRLSPSYAPTRYRSALARALDVIGVRPGRIVVVSDLQANGWAEGPNAAIPERIPVDVVDAGPQPVNAGIVAFEPIRDGLHARLRGTGPARVLTVELLIDDRSHGQQKVPLPADGTADVVFRVARPASGVARVRLAATDGLPGDDERWVVLDQRPRTRALVLTSPGAGQADGLYVSRALEAAEEPRAWSVIARAADRLKPDTDLAGTSAVIVVGTAGLDRRGVDALARFVQEGGGVLVATGPGVNMELLSSGFGEVFPRARIGPAADAPIAFAPTDVRHPIFRVFDPDDGAFNGTRFLRAASIVTTSGSEVLARFETGAPALVERKHGRGRLMIFGSDLSNRWNDLVLQPAFVPFIVETATWLGGSRTAPDALIAGVGGVAGAERPGVINWVPPGNAGISPTRLAVNADPHEFEPRRLAAPQFVAQVERRKDEVASAPAVARQQEGEQAWWRYGLGLMLLGLIVESVVGRRG